MKITNMTRANGNPVPNQFIVEETGNGALGNFLKRKTFQSYDSTIAVVTEWADGKTVKLDEDKWDYSITTRKYRSQFLGEGIEETRKRIKSGEYKLVDLN